MNWPNISNKYGTLSLNWLQCFMPSITAVRILSEFSGAGFILDGSAWAKAHYIDLWPNHETLITKFKISLYHYIFSWAMSTWVWVGLAVWGWFEFLFPWKLDVCGPKLLVNFQVLFWGCAARAEGTLVAGGHRGLVCWRYCCVGLGGL